MINEPQTVTVSVSLAILLQDIAGFPSDSQIPFQRQFEFALGILLALYNTISPEERVNLQQMVQERQNSEDNPSDSDES